MRRAIELLPPELKPLFERYRDEIVVRVKDPDLWRNAGWEDDPNHFVDFGMKELGEYPFTALPREYGAALEKFGASQLERIGRLPWREAEEFGNLRRGFEAFKHEGQYAPGDVVLFSAVASHYIQDAHADTAAAAGKDLYHDAYYEKFLAKVRPILEQRLSEAVTATAGIIIGAWDQAGRPALKLEGARPPQKIKKPYSH